MRRYGGDDESFFTDDEDEHMEQPQEVDAIIDIEGDLLASMELDILEQGLNQKLLDTVVNICKHDLFWYFRSHASKVKRIIKTYRKFTSLVRETLEHEEE